MSFNIESQKIIRRAATAQFSNDQLNIIRAALADSKIPGAAEVLKYINDGVKGKHGFGREAVSSLRAKRSYTRRNASGAK